MNTADAAAALGKKARWVRIQCATGQLRASFYGGSWDIDADAITAYKDARSNTPRTAAARRRPRRAS